MNCLCGRSIKQWEAVCFFCWTALEKHDHKFGTHFRKDIVKRFKETGKRDMLNKELLLQIKIRMIPEKSLQIDSLRRKVKLRCKECEEKTGRKDIDDCFNCPWHVLFNRMYHEILDNGHR